MSFAGAAEMRPRTLRGTWTMELAEDLRAVHGIDVESMLVEIMADEMRLERERQGKTMYVMKLDDDLFTL